MRSSPDSKSNSLVWFDTHCHLHLCDAPLEEVVGRASTAGVTEMVTLATDVGSSERAIELARTDGVHAGVGLHPNSSTEWDDAAAAKIEELLLRDGVVAVGETGLDFYRDDAPPSKQEEAFSAHISFAKRLGKALVIHTRESIDGAIGMLEGESPPERFIFHCWSGDTDQLRRALDLGAYISFAGNVSFKSAGDLRHAATFVPDERLLVETDSPYLAPVPHRGKPNEPAYVADVGAAVAEARGRSIDEIEELTTRNARAVFAL